MLPEQGVAALTGPGAWESLGDRTARGEPHEESKAYGYTLTIRGCGSLTTAQYHTPAAAEIFLYVAGAFAALALVAFDELFEDTGSGANRQLVIASTVHVGATFGNLLLVWIDVTLTRGAGVSALVVFPVVGFVGTFTYNAMLLEDRIAGVVTRAGREPDAAAD